MTSHEHANEGMKTIEQAARTAMLPSAEDEQRVARLSQRGDARAFEQLVRAHLRLVFAIARKFRGYGVPTDELVGEGVLGLVKAVRCYDSERGVRLATYAAWWIRAYMRRATLDNRRIVRGPSSRAARKVRAGLRSAERRIEQANGQPPDAQTVARALGVAASDVEEMRAVLACRDVPFDVEIAGRRFDIACDAPSPEAIAGEREHRRICGELLGQALAQLSPRARRIVEQRNLGADASTLAELSDDLGISRERVRQIEARAKVQLRAAIASAAMQSGCPLELA